MPILTLSGVYPYDGRYELRLEGDLFTISEWGWIKRFSGYLPATVFDGFDGGDPELMATFAVIALHRAGRITSKDARDVFDQIGRGQLGSTLQIEADPGDEDDEDDAGPPPSRSSANGTVSGDGSPTSSERSAPTPPATGTLGSGISASAPAMSAT